MSDENKELLAKKKLLNDFVVYMSKVKTEDLLELTVEEVIESYFSKLKGEALNEVHE